MVRSVVMHIPTSHLAELRHRLAADEDADIRQIVRGGNPGVTHEIREVALEVFYLSLAEM